MLNTRSVLEPEHEDFRRAVAAFMEREVVPNYPEWEKNGVVDRSVWSKAGEEGLLLMTAAEEYGGAGVDFRYAAVLNEEMSKRGISGPGFGLHSDIVAPYFTHYGTEEQKQRFLPRMAKGEIIGSIAMTEPGAGSDVQNIRTTALKDGNEYVVSGAKTFITNGELADFVLVAAKTDPSLGAKGISLIVVETNREGFSRGKKLDKMGEKAQDIAELHFDNIRVPPENLIGEEGKGFKIILGGLNAERTLIAAECIGDARWFIDKVSAYVKERIVFDRPIGMNQGVQFPIARAHVNTEAADLMRFEACRMFDAGVNPGAQANMAKMLAADASWEAANACIQFHGGFGFAAEYDVERKFRETRLYQVAPISTNLILSYVAEHVLGLPRSF